MPFKEQLLYMLQTTQRLTQPLIEDISDKESMVRGEHNRNHIRWQTGHLIHSDMYLVSVLGGDYPGAEKYKRLFEGGTEPDDESATYPSMAVLRDDLKGVQNELVALVGKMSDEDLQQELGGGQSWTKWQAASFICMHAFYHAGQITHIRNILGRLRPFK